MRRHVLPESQIFTIGISFDSDPVPPPRRPEMQQKKFNHEWTRIHLTEENKEREDRRVFLRELHEFSPIKAPTCRPASRISKPESQPHAKDAKDRPFFAKASPFLIAISKIMTVFCNI